MKTDRKTGGAIKKAIGLGPDLAPSSCTYAPSPVLYKPTYIY